MTILDERTKAMLDAGQVAVVDGGYLILTPETLRQSAESAAIEAAGEFIMEQAVNEGANSSFIQQECKCHFCGKESDCTEYTMKITGGYASGHDTESVTMEVCGECLEKMLAAVS